MHRSVLLLTTILLSGATAATLTVAAMTMAPPGSGRVVPAREEEAAKETVRRFYTAVNEAIATGRFAPVEAVLAPDFVDHQASTESTVGQRAFLSRLANVRAVFPYLRLAVDALSVDGDLVVAQLRTEEGHRGRIAGVPISAPGGGWSLLDRFRIEDDKIAERWPAPEHTTLAEPLAEGVVKIDNPTPRLVGLERLVLGPGDELRRSTGSDPRLLLLVSGTLTVRLDESAQAPLLIGDQAAWREIAPGHDGTVTIGEQLLASGDHWRPFTLHNDTSEPAEALSLSLENPTVRQPTDGANPPAAFPGPTVSLVAGGRSEPMSHGNATLQIARAVLAPGAALLPDEQSGAVLVAVQSGTLLVAADPPLADVFDPPGIRRYRPGEAPLGPGSGIQLSPGPAALTSIGEEPADVLIVTIAFAATA